MQGQIAMYQQQRVEFEGLLATAENKWRKQREQGASKEGFDAGRSKKIKLSIKYPAVAKQKPQEPEKQVLVLKYGLGARDAVQNILRKAPQKLDQDFIKIEDD